MSESSVYTRLIGIFGYERFKKFQEEVIGIFGLTPIGFEVARNISMTGIQMLHLCDSGVISRDEIGGGLDHLSDSLVGKKRFEHCKDRLKKYPTTKVEEFTDANLDDLKKGTQDLECLKRFSTIVICDGFKEDWERVEQFCFDNNIKFLFGNAYGLMGEVYVNLGKEYFYLEPNENSSNLYRVISVDAEKSEIKVGYCNSQFHMAFTSYFQIMMRKKGDQIDDVHDEEILEMEIEDVKWDKDFAIIKTYDKELLQKYDSTHDLDDENNLFFMKEVQMMNKLEPPHEPMISKIKKSFRPSKAPVIEPVMDETKVKEAEKPQYSASVGTFCPVNSFFAGVLSNEVIKALTHLYCPLAQRERRSDDPIPYKWKDFSSQLFFKEWCDWRQTRKRKEAEDDETLSLNGQRLLFGKVFEEVMGKFNMLVVGVGATGSELIKNMVTVGVGGIAGDENDECRSGMTIVDHDELSESNTTRQLFFEKSDLEEKDASGLPIKKFKALVCAEKVKKLVPKYAHVIPILSKIGHKGHTIHPEDWKKYSALFSTVDNVKARLFLEERAYCMNIPLFDCGTEGLSSGSVWTSLPYLSRPYREGTTLDEEGPGGEGKESCTFNGNPHTTAEVVSVAKTRISTFRFIDKDFKDTPETILRNCEAAFNFFFDHEIKEFVEQHPADHKTVDGNLFWEEGIVPIPVKFSAEKHKEFLDRYTDFVRDNKTFRAVGSRLDKDITSHWRLAMEICRLIGIMYNIPPPENKIHLLKLMGMQPAIVSVTSIVSSLCCMNAISYILWKHLFPPQKEELESEGEGEGEEVEPEKHRMKNLMFNSSGCVTRFYWSHKQVPDFSKTMPPTLKIPYNSDWLPLDLVKEIERLLGGRDEVLHLEELYLTSPKPIFSLKVKKKKKKEEEEEGEGEYDFEMDESLTEKQKERMRIKKKKKLEKALPKPIGMILQRSIDETGYAFINCRLKKDNKIMTVFIHKK